MDDLGGFPIIFGNTHLPRTGFCHHQAPSTSLNHDLAHSEICPSSRLLREQQHHSLCTKYQGWWKLSKWSVKVGEYCLPQHDTWHLVLWLQTCFISLFGEMIQFDGPHIFQLGGEKPPTRQAREMHELAKKLGALEIGHGTKVCGRCLFRKIWSCNNLVWWTSYPTNVCKVSQLREFLRISESISCQLLQKFLCQSIHIQGTMAPCEVWRISTETAIF